jgi:hypothetical protein
MTGAMQWDKASKLDRMHDHDLRGKQIVPIKADESFWRSWRGDPKTMRASGYRVSKVNGQWKAWIER